MRVDRAGTFGDCAARSVFNPMLSKFPCLMLVSPCRNGSCLIIYPSLPKNLDHWVTKTCLKMITEYQTSWVPVPVSKAPIRSGLKLYCWKCAQLLRRCTDGSTTFTSSCTSRSASTSSAMSICDGSALLSRGPGSLADDGSWWHGILADESKWQPCVIDFAW